MNAEDLQRWEALLLDLMKPDTQVISNATTLINQQLQNPMSIVALFHLLQGSNDLGVKQLSAILCRKRVGGHWSSLNAQTQEAIKVTIMETISKDDVAVPRVIKRAVADLAGAVARLTVPQGNWPNFLEFMTQLTLSQSTVHREIGIYILILMINSTTIRDQLLIPHLASVGPIIERVLKDPSPSVRVSGMEAYAEIIKHLSKEQLQPFFNSIVDIVNIMKYCLQEEDDKVSSGFEIFELLVEEHVEFLAPIIKELTEFMLSIVVNQEFQIQIKTQAINFIAYVISFKTKTFLEQNILQQTIELAFNLLCDPEDEEAAESTSCYRYGGELLDNICINVPPKFSWELLQTKVTTFYQSPNPNQRKAAFTALATFADGYGDYIEKGFADAFKMLLSGLSDPESVVRDAAYYTLGEFSNHLVECLTEYKNLLLPILQNGLKDPTSLVRIKCCYALSRCCPIMGEIILANLGELLNVLLTLAQHDKSIEVRELSLSCISSVAEAVGEDFQPYFGPVLLVLRHFLNLEEEKDLLLRGRAMDCIGVIFTNVKRDLWAPIIRDIVIMGVKGLMEKNDVDLRHYTYLFFESLLKVSPEDLLEFLPEIVKFLWSSIESNEGVVVQNAHDSSLEGIAEDSEADYERNFKLNVISTFMEEKVQAIDTLGWCAAAFEGDFATYFEKSFALLLQHIDYIDSDVVISVNFALIQVLSNLQLLSALEDIPENPDDEEDQEIDIEYSYVPGEIVTLNSTFATGVNAVLEKMIANKDFEDVTVVQSTVESFSKMASLFGPSAIHSHLPQLLDFIFCVLERKTPCQLNREVFNEDNAEEYSLFHTVMETLVDFGKVLEKLLVPYIAPLFERIRLYLGDNVPETYRAECLGLTCMMGEAMQASFIQFAQPLLSMAIPLLKSSHSTTVRNAAYTVRAMLELAGGSLMLYVPQLYSDISAIMSSANLNDSVAENCCGVFAAMLNLNPPGLPIDQIVQFFVNTLPVKDDFEVAPLIYECVIKGLQAAHPSFMNHVPSLIGILTIQYVEYSSQLSEQTDLLEGLVNMIKSFGSSFRAQLESIFMTLIQNQQISPENEGKLRELLA